MGKVSVIFRITQKLAKKIKVVHQAALPPYNNPLLDWTANLFTVSRRQCIILTNSVSLYSVIMPGKGVLNEVAFADRSLNALGKHMAFDGLLGLYGAYIAPHATEATFCRASDRRVLGSMNELVFQAKYYLLEMGLPLELASMRLNETPLSMLRYHNPKLSLLALAEELKA